ncbi:MAG: helix-turn-helix transcriptional regulator [Marinilabiliaceae bacterium]|nr:helix-turn-helix transcriptional regulator [Marinilabiliaceae bacterium]
MKELERLKEVVAYLIESRQARTKKDLAHILGYKEVYMSQLINGKTKITQKFLSRLTAYFSNINVQWITNGTGEMLHNPVQTNINAHTIGQGNDSFVLATNSILSALEAIVQNLKTQNEINEKILERLK